MGPLFFVQRLCVCECTRSKHGRVVSGWQPSTNEFVSVCGCACVCVVFNSLIPFRREQKGSSPGSEGDKAFRAPKSNPDDFEEPKNLNIPPGESVFVADLNLHSDYVEYSQTWLTGERKWPLKNLIPVFFSVFVCVFVCFCLLAQYLKRLWMDFKLPNMSWSGSFLLHLMNDNHIFCTFAHFPPWRYYL